MSKRSHQQDLSQHDDLTEEQAYLAQYSAQNYPSPLLTVDMAIFSVQNAQLKVLLIQRSNFPAKGQWALAGGFVQLQHDQDLLASAQRKLLEKTGIATPYLEQVASVGNAQRDPRGWSVTILYFALIDFLVLEQNNVQSSSTQATEQHQWFSLSEALQLKLAFDHQHLLQLAFERLKSRARYTALPCSLMPELFSLTELQHIYEIILGQSLEKKSFRRRMLDAGVVEETEYSKRAGKRNAQLYRYALDDYAFNFPRILEYPREMHE